MKLVEHYIMRGTRRLVLIIVGFLIFIFASYSAQRYLTEAANGTLALDVVLDIVFYKVLIALEMLLPVGLYVSVGVTLGQMYTDSEITAISAAGGSPGRLYKAVLYLAIPLSIFVTLLSMYGRPWAYAQIYQLEQQSQSELDVRQLRAKKFNTNDNGRMILSQTVDQDNNRLTDALIYTSTANRTRIFRARSVDVVDPSPEKPTVMLHNGTAYLLDHQGRDDNEQIYRNLQLHLNPLDQSPNVKRKAKSVTELARSAFPADHAELQWRQSRGLTALLMALLAISLSRVLEGIQTAAAVSANRYVEQQLLLAADRVREGSSLRAALAELRLFPPMMLYMIASGEQSGELETMLEQAAVNQEREFDTQVGLALGLFEPALVVMMAGVVLFIVIAILEPMLQLNNMVGM